MLTVHSTINDFCFQMENHSCHHQSELPWKKKIPSPKFKCIILRYHNHLNSLIIKKHEHKISKLLLCSHSREIIKVVSPGTNDSGSLHHPQILFVFLFQTNNTLLELTDCLETCLRVLYINAGTQLFWHSSIHYLTPTNICKENMKKLYLLFLIRQYIQASYIAWCFNFIMITSISTVLNFYFNWKK